MDIDTFLIKTAEHLATQRKQCAINGLCRYADNEGGHCAIGVHLSDDLCRELDREGHAARFMRDAALWEPNELTAKKLNEHRLGVQFMKDLGEDLPVDVIVGAQDTHDYYNSRGKAQREAMLRDLANIAKEHGAERAVEVIPTIECPDFPEK